MCGPERVLGNKSTNKNTGYLKKTNSKILKGKNINNSSRRRHWAQFALTTGKPSRTFKCQVCRSEGRTLDSLLKEYNQFFLRLFFLAFSISKEPVSLCTRTRCEFHFSLNRWKSSGPAISGYCAMNQSVFPAEAISGIYASWQMNFLCIWLPFMSVQLLCSRRRNMEAMFVYSVGWVEIWVSSLHL